MWMTLLTACLIDVAEPEETGPDDTDTVSETGDTGDTDDDSAATPQTCDDDADCAKVYSDCSYCHCEAVPASQAWTRDDLGCDTYTGAVCDYDCGTDDSLVPRCVDEACVLVVE